jgi:hypothetical protein
MILNANGARRISRLAVQSHGISSRKEETRFRVLANPRDAVRWEVKPPQKYRLWRSRRVSIVTLVDSIIIIQAQIFLQLHAHQLQMMLLETLI